MRHSPPSGANSTPEALLGISQFFPLSEIQIGKARGLGMSDEQIQAIQKRFIRGTGIANKLAKDGIAQNYINFLLKDIFPEDHVSEKDFNNPTETEIEILMNSIEELIGEIFTEENLQDGIPYIAPYYGPIEHRQRYLYMMSLLHSWKILGKDNPLYGRVCVLSNFKQTLEGGQSNLSKEAVKIWGYYQSHPVKGERYYYVLGNKQGKNVISEVGPEKVKREDMPKVFSFMGEELPQKGEDVPPEDLAYLEEMFSIFPTRPDEKVPYTRLFHAFLRKHRAYFDEDRETRCPWPAGKKILKQWEEAEAQVEAVVGKKKRKKTITGTRGSSETQTGVVTKEVTPTENAIANFAEVVGEALRSFQKPVLRGNIAYFIENHGISERPIRDFIANFAEDTILWMGEQKGSNIRWKRFSPEDFLTIEKAEQDTTYVFCFSASAPLDSTPPEDEIRSPREILRVQPKLRKPSGGNDQGKNNPPNNPPNSPPSQEIPQASSISGEQESALELSLEILEAIDREDYESGVSSDGNILTVSFFLTPTVSAIFRGDSGNLEIILSEGAGGIASIMMGEIGSDIQTFCQGLYVKKKSEQESVEKRELQESLEKGERLLREIFRYLTEGNDAIDIEEIMGESVINDRYAGTFFQHDFQKGKLVHLQKMLREKGIELDLFLADSAKNEYGVRISLVGMPHIHAEIKRIKTPPYSTLSGIHENLDENTTRKLNSISRFAFVILGIAGKKLWEIAHANTGGSQERKSGYSEEEIEQILAGTYKKPEVSWENMPPEERNLITQAVKRFQRGKGKKLQGEVLEVKKGKTVLSYKISSKNGLQDYYDMLDEDEIILVDEKFSCPNPEKLKKPKKGVKNPYKHTYDKLSTDERAQKYMVLRMIATVKDMQGIKGGHKGVTAFQNEMRKFFEFFWNSLPETIRREFFEAVTLKGVGKAGSGLKVKITEEGLFDAFIRLAQNPEKQTLSSSQDSITHIYEKTGTIPFTYSRPKVIKKGELSRIIQQDIAGWKWLDREVNEEEADILEIETME